MKIRKQSEYLGFPVEWNNNKAKTFSNNFVEIASDFYCSSTKRTCSRVNNMYIYNLPYQERRQLCFILDQNNKWEELASIHMKFDIFTLDRLRKEIYRGNSPSSELLNLWGHHNHTVLELFVLLYHMKHYQAMVILKQFVDEKYHRLIKNGDDQLCGLLKNLEIKQLNVNLNTKTMPENFNSYNSEKLLNVEKHVLEDKSKIVSNENNVSEAVLHLKPKSPLLQVNKAGNSKMWTVSDISSVVGPAGSTPHILYAELQASTKNWDDKAILGKGGFGTVYRGTWRCTQVAIKRLEQKQDKPDYQTEQIKQSMTELRCLNSYRHDNVLPLYGYSMDGLHPCLIYQYMAGGSLDYRLRRTTDTNQILSWPSRLNIAIGVARGLQFLHTTLLGETPLVHGDIKSANILLDPSDQPRIGDFGLAREGPQNNYTHIKVSKIQGTRPYLPDEFLRGGKFSTKVDTFSFGVVLFEIATALNVYRKHGHEEFFLKDIISNHEGDIVELKDRRVPGYDEYYKGLIEIGKMCVSKRAKDRPEMVNVLIMLEGVPLSNYS